MIDNQNGVKLKDSDLRQEAYKQYCKHIAEGWPKESFVFEHPEFSVHWQTIDKYIEDNPSEFDPILMKKARSLRYKHWFGKGANLMEGKFKNGSPVVWQTIMRNIFKDVGWDREELTQDNKPHIAKLAENLRSEPIPEAEESDKGI